MGNEITVYEKIQDPFAAAIQIGPFLAKSGLFGCKKEEQGVVIALTCQAERISPMAFNRTYHITDDNKLVKKASSQYAEFRRIGGRVKWLTAMADPQRAEAEVSFEGQTIMAVFTMEDAKRQRIVRDKSAWVKTPSNMLRARMLTNALGMLAPEIVAGCGEATEDEVIDSSRPLDMERAKPIDVTAELVPPSANKMATEAAADSDAYAVKLDAEPPKSNGPVQAESATGGRLTQKTVEALMAAIGDANGEKALKWLGAKGWIKPLGDLGDMSLRHAQAILDRPENFLKAIAG